MIRTDLVLKRTTVISISLLTTESFKSAYFIIIRLIFLFDQLLLTHITKDSETRRSLRMIVYDFVRFAFERRIALLYTFVSSFLLTISYSTCSVFMRLTLPVLGAPSSFAVSTGSTDSYEFSGWFL